MSITLITAAPGAGKTIFAVWNIIKPAVEADRVVYTAGIPELKLPAISLSYSQVKRWADRELVEVENPSGIPIPDDEKPSRLQNITEGALIVIDEVQYLWPASGSREPGEDIKYLTKHRHHGLEFVLITQAPQLIHKNVLAVVDKHIHMLSDWHGRKRYEWPEYCATVRATSSKLKAVSQRYELPKEAYGLYRSASMHITQKRRKPLMAYVVPIAFFALIYTGFTFKDRFLDSKSSESPKVVKDEQKTDDPHLSQQKLTSAPVTTVTTVARPVTLALVSDQIDWSKVGACVATQAKCICYGKSAERLVVPPETCRKAVSSGWPGQETKV
ncbi:zonular occludens toxin family protein [Nitrosomonas europaea]|uniref:Zona occludens toxin N-terminal domain-containing protein n=1 Tax=Nitrosomonas europaea (strain ATCC 19718 / CIP 103999 / KCTC 2705 / NBRC 14298) TaxID=228410 RepID=Q82W06_NITEU|nr:zonular occludens toxin domain-containing protein [Nitrosomonas europaea]CAD84804.1 conserved hypothetical protein [Nitrosomonas europaea ATCC 19718]SDW17371.1 zona occludens toxin [Nitrosomonas europaea]SJZ33913.1 zona occludens toxin [Nitrosomonas europaea]